MREISREFVIMLSRASDTNTCRLAKPKAAPMSRKLTRTIAAVVVKVRKYVLCIAYSTDSNLYPTPQTVLSDHLSETPSSFSRRRLIWTSTVRESPK